MNVLEPLLGAPAQAAGPVLSAGEMFMLFFIMLGPLKLLGPFASQTSSLAATNLRELAWRSTGVAALSLLLAGLVGRTMLVQWRIAPDLLTLSLGLIFFAVAFRIVMQQYVVTQPFAAGPAPSTPAEAPPGVMRIVFPGILPPYGIAGVIVLLALSDSIERTLLVWGLAFANLALDLLAMLFVRSIMQGVGVAIMQVAGAIVGVMQVALAVQIILRALQRLELIGGTGF